MSRSKYEEMARRRAAEIGATIRRDNRNRLIIVSLGKTQQQFWQGSWTDIWIWLDKQKPKRQKGG